MILRVVIKPFDSKTGVSKWSEHERCPDLVTTPRNQSISLVIDLHSIHTNTHVLRRVSFPRRNTAEESLRSWTLTNMSRSFT